MDLILLIFVTTIIAEILLGVGLLVSLFMPKYRIYPPPGKNSWQFVYIWFLVTLTVLGVILLAVFDWNNFLLMHWIRYPLGLSFIAFTFLLWFWSSKSLTLRTSFGLGGKLATRGPYKYTRNPAYLADMLCPIGIAILSNSLLVLILGLVAVAILLLILTPFIEEPWLREKYGEEYDSYRKKVPRFI